MDIGEQLKNSRIRLTLNQSQLAAIVGISQQHLSLIEKGKIHPGIKTLRRLCGALGLELALRGVSPSVQWNQRFESWRRFNQWEESERQPLNFHQALEKAGALADLYKSLHKEQPENIEVQARDWKLWKSRLAKIP